MDERDRKLLLIMAQGMARRGGRESRSEPLRGLLLRRLSGNVGKHSLEYFTSDFVGVFVRPVLRLGFFVLSGRFSVGSFTSSAIIATPLKISWQDQIVSSIPYIA